MLIGKRFASPIKQGPRAKRARDRDEMRPICQDSPAPVMQGVEPSSSELEAPTTADHQLQTAMIGEQLLESNYLVHELPTGNDEATDDCSKTINTALLARIEMLEAENDKLKSQGKEQKFFRMECIAHDDNLVCFYTGFISYAIFVAFFEFLGPVVNQLLHWGSREGDRQRNYNRKLDPKNQLFLTLVKLRLNLKLEDLSCRFGLSTSLISRYITTWICFLYQVFMEVDWMPSIKQVQATLPSAFKEKFATTYAIIDGSEIFIETPSDLFMQSSTWSQYKQHNTVKFLVACTPNGGICYISPVYVGSISDVELTRRSGFLAKLKDKPGISIMADRGFTIKDLLKELHIDLNIPPFLEGRRQLPSTEVDAGRKIASVRIHVERAIGRIKCFSILKGTIPISLARLTNHIVCVCAFLTNFGPALVSSPETSSEDEVDAYFAQILECDSDISEASDTE